MTTSVIDAAGPNVEARYLGTRRLTEELAAGLSAEDQTVQSMPDVSPTKWHRAHTTWFFETFLLVPHLAGYEVFHPAFRYLFNSYYEALGPRHARPERGLLSRPGIEQIAAYRRHVDEAMSELLSIPQPADVSHTVELGIHHEQQHEELLLMDIKHVLSVNPLLPTYRSAAVLHGRAAPALEWHPHDGGAAAIGHEGNGFCFDNETPRHAVTIAPFALASRPAVNGEWLAFMDDGGYSRPELWLSDGWATVCAQGWRAPLYWFEPDGTWQVFTLGGPRAIDVAEPVCHISYYEADAFARWSDTRLPTEAEWEVAASGRPAHGRFLDLDILHPQPAPRGEGPVQLFGDVWEWTASAYLPYPGFRPEAGAVGEYNGKFMVNQHVLRGGCCATPPGHVRATYRNFFPPSARWMFGGARLARDV